MKGLFSNWFSAASVCFLVLWAGLLALAPAHMLGDPGTFWHTVAGERMLETGEVIRTDPFSFTCQGQPWVAQQWLGEIVMALLHRLAGLDAVVLAAVTILAATYAWLFGRLRRSGLSWPRAAILLGLVVAASSYHFLPRPHIVTIALMAGTFALLLDVESGRRNPRWLLALPPLYVLWTNVHGGALGGIATSTGVLVAWLFWRDRFGANEECRMKNVESSVTAAPLAPGRLSRGAFSQFSILHSQFSSRIPHRPPVSPFLIALVAGLSFTAVLANPYGAALPRVWIGLMRSEVLPRLIVEHAPLRIVSVEGVMVVALAGVYLAILARTWRSGRRVTWLMPLLWLVLAFMRVRHGPLLAVTAGLAIADMLACRALKARAAWAGRAAHGGTNVECRIENVESPATAVCHCSVSSEPVARRLAANTTADTAAAHRRSPRGLLSQFSILNSTFSILRPALLPLAAVILALTLQAAGVRCPIVGAGWSRVSPDRWPVEAVEALCANLPTGERNVKVFNDLGFGGYLIYAAPQTRVYIDDRCELYGDHGLREYERLTKDPALVDALALYDDIPYALTRAHSRFDRHLAASPFWTLLHRDATAALYARAPRTLSRYYSP